jgi:hypothetical protein
MQLTQALLFLALSLLKSYAFAAEPDAYDSIHRLSNDVIEINIQIEVASGAGLSNVNHTALNVTRSSRQCEKSPLVTSLTAGASRRIGSSALVYNGTSQQPTASLQGMFSNSTHTPSATGSFRTPSQAEFAPFFSRSVLVADIHMPFVWSVAGLSCVMSVFF